MKTTLRFFFCLAGFALLFTHHAARCAAIAGAEIELNGKVIAGCGITHSSQTREELFQLLATHPLTFERDFKVPVDEKVPTMAKLEGAIRIHTRIAKDKELGATAAELTLIQREGKWYVEKESLARAQKAGKENLKTSLQLKVWDNAWKVQSTYLLNEKGLEKLKIILGRKPDESADAQLGLLPSGTMQYDGKTYAVEEDKIILLAKNGAKIWNQRGIRDELLKLSELQAPHKK